MSSATTNWCLVAGIAATIAVAVASFLPSQRSGARAAAAVLLMFGPVLALVAIGNARSLVTVIAVSGAALAAFGCLASTMRNSAVLTTCATAVVALAVVIAGLRIGPTGVAAIDVVVAFAVVLVVSLTFLGFDRPGGLGIAAGIPAALGVFAIAGFGAQGAVAALALVAAGTCLGSFTASPGESPQPAEVGARLLAGFLVSTGALAMRPVDGDGRPAATAAVLLSLLVLDGAFVVIGRFRRHLPIWEPQRDHLVDRLVARRWSRTLAIVVLVAAQAMLGVVAVLAGRGIIGAGAAAAVAAVVVVLVALLARRAVIAPAPTRRLGRWVALGAGVVVVALLVATVPMALATRDVVDDMEAGRDAAKRGLSAARDGDTEAAAAEFRSASAAFTRARDRLESPLVIGARGVPYVASNVNAARKLADVGQSLATSGESVATAVDPDALEVIDGRLPLEQVAELTPDLEEASDALAGARDALDDVRGDPYLVGRVREAVDDVWDEVVRADREATHAAAAARLAPELFGANGERRYLLVVQNPAEARATGGFIGSYGLLTARDGKLDVDDLLRTREWNEALRANPDLTLDPPADYKRRYAQYLPATTMQSVNFSPDFPSVAGVLMQLAPQAGVGPVDGVLSVDPFGLAALLELTGPVDVEGWPEPITAENVVKVTLEDAYAAFDGTDRVDFLGDVAEAAVEKATSGNLGKPSQIAKVLGAAAHEGHLVLAFDRAREERLAETLDVAGELAPVRGDSVLVTTSNFGANKVDVFLQRRIDYRMKLSPNNRARAAEVTSDVTIRLDNGAPSEGLPQIVIGPFNPSFTAGVNRSLLSIYTPLALTSFAINGQASAQTPARELDRNVYSNIVSVPPNGSTTVTAGLEGAVRMRDGWYELDLGYQPTYRPDQVTVSIEVPDGWRVDRAENADVVSATEVSATLEPRKPERIRVHVTRADSASLWERLEAGK